MVRFSDMLGGSEDAERPRATTISDPVPVDDIPVPEPDAEDDVASANESPQEVLDRLTQYATSTRSSDDAPEPPPPEAIASAPPDDAPAPLTPVGDDLLPHTKADKGKRRRK
jgi:hypothetical protein